ncbi:MAG TPA: hypothetical protein VF173_20200 [Thermoanaerobaculia bacterium]|nr:hypothetical protein [Thermoanaerobaculia bacterium]
MSSTSRHFGNGGRRGAARLIVFATALAFLGSGAPARAQQTLEKAIGGPEQLLSPTGKQPAIATYGKGGFVVVWADTENNDPDDLGIRGTLVRPGALAPGQQFTVSTTTAGVQNHPAVSADSSGRFVVAWQSADLPAPPLDPGSSGIFGQRFGIGGAKQGDELPLTTSVTDAQLTPTVAMGDDGAFVASWVDVRDGFKHISAARFSVNSAPVGLEIDLPTLGDFGNEDPEVVHYPGGFAVGWNEIALCPFGGNPDNAAVKRFDNEGGTAGRVYRLTGELCAERGFGLAGLASSHAGALAVFSGPDGYSGQRFAPSGEAVGGLFPLGGPPCTDLTCRAVRAVAMDDNGRFALVWETTVNGVGSNLAAQLYTAANRPRSVLTPVNLTPSKGLETPVAALANDGTLEIAWSRLIPGDAVHTGLFVRRLRMP